MGTCVQCGNDYDKSFEVRMNGRTMIFDSFECAIQALAPVCPHCGCRIIGHGVQHGDTIFLLLRPLRRGGRRQRPARPRLGRFPSPTLRRTVSGAVQAGVPRPTYRLGLPRQAERRGPPCLRFSVEARGVGAWPQLSF
jgi:hypothetical protein